MPGTYPFVEDAETYDLISDAMVIGAEGGKKVRLVSLEVTAFEVGSISGEFEYEDESAFFSGTPNISLMAMGPWTEIKFTEGAKQIQIDFTGVLPVTLEGPYQFADSVHA